MAGRKSPRTLYRTDFVTFEADQVYRQRDAEGFINLNALRLKIRALRDRAHRRPRSRMHVHVALGPAEFPDAPLTGASRW